MNHIPLPASSRKYDGDAFALFQLGFRPFFLGAALFSVISMIIWLLDIVSPAQSLPASMSPMYWHAHEMLYGYALAVVAGFLLTAVGNWTQIRTAHGRYLQWLFLPWALARITMFMPGPTALIVTAALDIAFGFLLSIALTRPIIQAKLWKNLGVISKIYFLLLGNLVFYLGQMGIVQDGTRIGIYIGMYMVLSLILVLSRRVMPMFIERGVGYAVGLRNYAWLDISAFLVFLAFAVSDVFLVTPALTAWLAAILFVLHGIRLWGWHTPGIWKKPLLWSLFLAYAWLVFGFGLRFMAFAVGISPYLAIHAFTVGGIAMMTLGMMSRVSLGHTGRDIMHPPPGLGLIFSMLCMTAVVRVIFPLAFNEFSFVWIWVSQVLWIMSFSMFLLIYSPILIRPRIDIVYSN